MSEQDGCSWAYDDSPCNYDTSCGHSFEFLDDGITENGFKFCPWCGRSIVEVKREPTAKPRATMSDTKVIETQWTTSEGLDVNVHPSDLDECHVGVSFIGYNSMFSVDMNVDDLLKLRDELTRAITDSFRSDETIRCPACGYTWQDAQLHCDHRTCRRYPFFPDETGKSHAV